MAWSWRCETAEGEALTDEWFSEEAFSSRGDAETWLGENWQEIAAAGAERAILVDGERDVYSMSLSDPL
ncbi:hypothetical protein FHX37_1971 [Haloactinospora alba]|uniref:Uncharacterized protein n=1 Tax=Haloactinospora alba TaxID=405555 RepID=A0A543NJR4_9ACTN|nr:hypothetical protein [Haloactinospora alba]TQN32046.1 hypothetical protein FHX37_1971 [Haloactinospora alba]